MVAKEEEQRLVATDKLNCFCLWLRTDVDVLKRRAEMSSMDVVVAQFTTAFTLRWEDMRTVLERAHR